MANEKVYSGKEIAQHNNRESCWIIVHGAFSKIYRDLLFSRGRLGGMGSAIWKHSLGSSFSFGYCSGRWWDHAGWAGLRRRESYHQRDISRNFSIEMSISCYFNGSEYFLSQQAKSMMLRSFWMVSNSWNLIDECTYWNCSSRVTDHPGKSQIVKAETESLMSFNQAEVKLS